MIGPVLPPHLAKRQQSNEQQEPLQDAPTTTSTEEEQEVTDNVSYGPPLPPEMLAERQKKRIQGPSLPETSTPTDTNRPTTVNKRVFGPARPSHTMLKEDSDSEEAEIGPMPLPAGAEAAMAEIERERRLEEIEARMSGKHANQAKAADPSDSKPVRGEWMLVPPSASDIRVDPLKLRSGGFRQVEGRGYRGPREEHENFLWTESPAEREKRLARELEAKQRGETHTLPRTSKSQRQPAASTDNEPVAPSIDRGPSLLELHLEKMKKKRANSESDDSSRRRRKHDKEEDETGWRPFDRERDMAVQRVDVKRQRQFLQKGNLLSDRFSRGRN